MPVRSAHELDVRLGLLYYTLDLDLGPLEASIERPEGFVVVEEVNGLPCTEFRGTSQGDRAVYLMVKHGVDHLTAVRAAERALRRRVHALGVKDANALTYQLVYVFGPPPRSEVSLPRVSLRFVGMHEGQLDHTGNRFQVSLHVANVEELRRRVSLLSSLGFVLNYFGYQRFGLRRPNNHLVGKAIAQGDLRGAVDLIVGSPFPSEPPAARAFRSLYDRGDLRGALEAVPPRGYELERTVLSEYLRGGDPARALRASPVPPSFFVEAYQSYLFNLCLSRMAEQGLPSPGARVRVPSRAIEAEGTCREVMRDEGVTELARPELGVRAREMIRQALTPVRGLGVDEEGRLSFALPRGSYATVVLREVLRQDPLTFA